MCKKCMDCNYFEVERKEIELEFGYVLLYNLFKKSINRQTYLGFANTPSNIECVKACKNFKNYDEEWLE